MISETLRKELTRQHYKIVGGHSAVKLCTWLKKSIRGEGACYKQRWYGIESHRCLQMTPWLGCDNKCIFCWRIIEKSPLKFGKIDEPKAIVDGCVDAQASLINGYPGWEGTDMRKWKEANRPNQAAISLTGEPTLYPKLSGLIEEFHNRKMTTFLVTNGQHPEVLESMTEPTQLYISVDAPDKPTLRKLDRPGHHDYWERLNRSLDAMNSMGRCRKVIRLTMVKGHNMENAKGYAKLIEKASPDFIESRGFVHVGEAQKRLPREAMPLFDDVKSFSEKISELTGYRIKDCFSPSRVFLLSKT